MRRSSYLARIFEDVTPRKRQPLLNPPRLLFRPSPVALDLGLAVEAEPSRARANTPRRPAADPGRSESDGANPESPRELRHSLRPTDPDVAQGATTLATPPLVRGPDRGTPAQAPHPRKAAEPSRENHSEAARILATPDATLRAPTNAMPRKRSEPARSEQAVHNANALQALEKPHAIPSQRRELLPAKAPFSEASTRSAYAQRKLIEPSERRPTAAPVPGTVPVTRVALSPPLRPGAAPPRKETEASRNRVHIGSLEVKIISPAPVAREPTAPPAAARRGPGPSQPVLPLARGFGVFGFLQS